MTLLLVSCGPDLSEVHRLPDGFEGPVLILFGMPGHDALEQNDGHLIYELNEQGLLNTSSPAQYGNIEHTYLYVRGDSSHFPIPAFGMSSEIPNDLRDSVVVYRILTGQSYNGIEYRSYIVGKIDSSAAMVAEVERMIDNIE